MYCKTYKSCIQYSWVEFLISVLSILNEVLIIYEEYTEHTFLVH